MHKRRQETGFHEYYNFYRACKVKQIWNKILTKQEVHIQDEIWKKLVWLHKRTGLIDNISTIQSRAKTLLLQADLLKIRNQIQKVTHLLRKLSYREERRKQNEAIKKALQKRYKDLKTN